MSATKLILAGVVGFLSGSLLVLSIIQDSYVLAMIGVALFANIMFSVIDS